MKHLFFLAREHHTMDEREPERRKPERKRWAMEETTYTLHIRHPSRFDYHVTIPEMGVTTQSTVNLDTALMLAEKAIEKHLTTRYLTLVFVDQEDGLPTDPEQQAVLEVAHLGIAPQVQRRERHLVFALAHPFTREQARWLDEQNGKLFDRYYTRDEMDIALDTLPEEAHGSRKVATNE
jgi:hypothetical protein